MNFNTDKENKIEGFLLMATMLMVGISYLYYFIYFPHIIFEVVSKEMFYSIAALQFIVFILAKILKLDHLEKFTCVIPSILMMNLLIFSFGGLNSPGVLWITGTPIFMGVFYKRTGMLTGLFVMLCVFTFFLVFDYHILELVRPLTSIEYKSLLRSNIIQFSALTTVYFSFYIWLESNHRTRLIYTNKQLDTLLHVVLHDLSNPITILKLKIKNLSRKHDLGMKSEQQINNSFSKIEEIIKSVRTFQLDTDNLTFQKAEISPDFIHSYSKRFFESHNTKNLKLHFDIDTNKSFLCEKRVLTDHILGHVLTNAIKFSHDGQDILIKVYNDTQKLYIDVIDKGVGIPKNLIKDIFKFDKKSKRIGTHGESGTGYGLPIVKYFTDYSNGRVAISSEHKIGTRVSLAFNLAKKS
ncbi:GHKL domain protein [Halobacteriovorax sp. BALOs_7]|uniref:histidine kinase n=1 Tax=Halobacteriovorax vibrionivorans TaxID=2152716 RepID=A0ABY0IJ91_9BACT|nr:MULTISPECIES: HAMP domain-containing sensor histidine kinase [Halobacteriovorax]AYF45629.1 GHKL domain protein [Halobacteriovorax sp. BALOs_7]RZF22692.1 HAMP domain-containing histidine kinase [Halobacteriovorax vibrionivorans]TGD46713.1 HAMP domain-containing histidine kinase [Halobacteriovorax sp. Y22]